MSPEQARGAVLDLDERTDVFALGAILCEVLTGQPPYVAETSSATRALAATADLEAVRERIDGSGADAELRDVARICLRADPDERPRDASQVTRLIVRYLAGVEERARAAELRAASAAARADSERRVRRLAVTLAVVVLVAISTWMWSESSRRARVTRAEHAVTEAVDEATKLWRVAISSPEGELAPWTAAIAAAEQAATISAASEVAADTRERVRELEAQIRAEHETAQTLAAEIARDRETIHRLDEIRIGTSELAQDEAKRHTFADVLRDYGIDVVGSDNDEIVRIAQKSRIRDRLAAALDEWSDLIPQKVGNIEGLDPSFGIRLRKLADRIESSPLRIELRAAGRVRDQQALTRFADRMQLGLVDVETFYLWARLLTRSGRADLAEEVLERVQIRYPDEFHVSMTLGLLAYRAKPTRLDVASRHLACAVSARPRSEQARFWLLCALWENGDERQARTLLAELAQRIAPKKPWVIHVAAELTNRHRLDLAQAMIDEAHAAGRESCRSFRILGNIYKWRNDFAAAEKAWRRALELHESNDRPETKARHLDDLAYALLVLGRYEESAVLYEEVTSLVPHWAQIYGNLATCMAALERYSDCLRWAKESLRRNPNSRHTLFMLAQVQSDIRDLDGALASFEAGIATLANGNATPRELMIQVKHAEVLRRGGRFDDCASRLAHIEPRAKTVPALQQMIAAERQQLTRALQLAAELTAYTTGGKKPRTSDIPLVYELCIARGEYATAARISKPGERASALDLEHFISASVLAGTSGKGTNAQKHRAQALESLGEVVRRIEAPEVIADAGRRAAARKHLERLLLDPRLSVLRDSASARVTESEAKQWESLWTRVREGHAKLSKG